MTRTHIENLRKSSLTSAAAIVTYVGRFTKCNTPVTKGRCGDISVSVNRFTGFCVPPCGTTVGMKTTAIVDTFGSFGGVPYATGSFLLGQLLERR